MLDEGIDVIARLWDGDLTFKGQHYDVDLAARDDLAEVLNIVQTPRPPIWVVGAWPHPKSMRRVLCCDGLLPVCKDEQAFRPTTPQDIRDMRTWLSDNGAGGGLDVVMEGETPADDPAKATDIAGEWADAGCTWWLDARWEMPHHGPDRERQVKERLEAGPPRIS